MKVQSLRQLPVWFIEDSLSLTVLAIVSRNALVLEEFLDTLIFVQKGWIVLYHVPVGGWYYTWLEPKMYKDLCSDLRQPKFTGSDRIIIYGLGTEKRYEVIYHPTVDIVEAEN